MTRAIFFWVVILVWLIFGGPWFAESPPYKYGRHFIIFVLLVLLGWQVFGPPVKG